MEIPSYALQAVTNYLKQRAEEVYEEFTSYQGIDSHPWAYQTEPVQKFVNEQAPLCAEEMMQEYEDADINYIQENCQSLAKLYIDENYDPGFIYEVLSRKYDIDKVIDEANDVMRSLLQATVPYSNYQTEYFLQKTIQIPSLKERLSYCDTNGVHNFVEKYAPQYVEEASKVR